MTKILIVEDDYNLSKSVGEWLRTENHIVENASSGEAALAMMESSEFDLLIIDSGLPGIDGLHVARYYRSTGGSAPIMFLTARDTIPDKEAGFGAGADDYLTKPFDMRELSLRVQALLRRPKSIQSRILVHRHVRMDIENFTVNTAGKEIYLQRMEFSLLEFFMRNPDTVFSAETIIKKVWPSDTTRSPKNLRVLINKLRDKIDLHGEDSLIETIPRRGYKLVASMDQTADS